MDTIENDKTDMFDDIQKRFKALSNMVFKDIEKINPQSTLYNQAYTLLGHVRSVSNAVDYLHQICLLYAEDLEFTRSKGRNK